MEISLENNMLRAVKKGDLKLVCELLAKGANPNKTVRNGRTCLGEAVFKGFNKIALEMIAKSHNNDRLVLSEDEEEEHCFFINRNREAKVTPAKRKLDLSMLSKTKTDKTNAKETKSNKEFYTISHDDGSNSGHGKVVTPISPQTDLEWDEDIGEVAATTKEDELMVAMYKWYASILESTGAAVVAAAEYTCGIDQEDAYGRTALSYACDENHVEIVQALIDAGCKIDILGSATGWTVLHSACAANNLASVKLLVAAGCNVNLRTPMKTTALHMAASHSLEMVTTLVEHGAVLDLRDDKDRTALYIAASQGHPDIVEYLASQGAHINIADQDGHSALCAAVTFKHIDTVAMLFRCGARITHVNCLIYTSVTQESYNMVKVVADNFIIKGYGINMRNRAGDTPLLLAVSIDNAVRITQLLLDKGAHVNICNTETGVSPLHVAVEYGTDLEEFDALVDMLLDYQINIDKRAITRDTALNRAILLHKDRIAMRIISQGANVNLCQVLTHEHGNLIIAGNRKGNKLANMLIKAGHKRVPPKFFNKPNNTTNWILEMYKTPLSLANICRIRIREMPMKGKRLRRYNTRDFVKALPIPPLLKNFLLMKELLC